MLRLQRVYRSFNVTKSCNYDVSLFIISAISGCLSVAVKIYLECG